MNMRGFWSEVVAYFEKEIGENIRGYDAIMMKWKLTICHKIVAFSVVYDNVKRMNENESYNLNVFQRAEYETHLRIEEGLRNQELDTNPKGKNQIGSSSVNMVKRDGAKNSNNNKNKRKFKSGDDKLANKKGTITCWKCKKTGHMKKDCCSRKGNNGAGSNGSKDPEKQQAIHVCKDLRWFQVCKLIEDRSFVKMGNIATEPIKGIGRVLLTFTSGKALCLDNLLYIPGI
nr:zinc finger, CCHC-type [Tanacetum cinerariifolium]